MSEFLNSLNTTRLNEYQIHKRNWLMESKDLSEITIQNYWTMLENNSVNILELSKGRDLWTFSKPEIVEILNYAPTIQKSVKQSLNSVMSKYNQWAIERGFNLTGENSCTQITSSDIKINKKAFDMSYITLDEFYDFLDTLRGSYNEKLILIMARYGVKIKDIANVKWEDVNRENMSLVILTEDKCLSLPIDSRFIEYVDKAKDENQYEVILERKVNNDNGFKIINYTVGYDDYGYIIKTTNMVKNTGNTVNVSTIRNRVNEMAKRGTVKDKEGKSKNVARPNIGDYNKSRRYDFLYEALNKNGVVTIEDVKDVIILFDGFVTEQKTYSLKNNFELLSGKNILLTATNKAKL